MFDSIRFSGISCKRVSAEIPKSIMGFALLITASIISSVHMKIAECQSIGERLYQNEILYTNQWLHASVSDAWLIVQSDGNLVGYCYHIISSASAFFATGTHGQGSAGHFLALQSDGNLVLYGGDGVVLWSTNTFSSAGDLYLEMQNDRNIVLYANNGSTVLWTSDTNVPS